MKEKSFWINFIIYGIIIFVIFYCWKDNIFSIFNSIFETKSIVINNNDYAKKNNYEFVKLTDDFYARDEKHLINIIYTFLNSGEDEFSFYCSIKYKNCMEDIQNIADDQILLSEINNFVHPYNSYQTIYFSFINGGKVILKSKKNYSDEEIIKINNRVDEIINSKITNNMDDVKKVEIIHDYIINNTKYKKTDDASKATSILFNHTGTCKGYTDTMAIYLYKFNIDNYKISGENHVWNLVKINNNWYHLDVTFDDPVVSDGSNRLYKKMFLINNEKLWEQDTKNHTFNKEIYLEPK